jgi:segregation and condensation protein B
VNEPREEPREDEGDAPAGGLSPEDPGPDPEGDEPSPEPEADAADPGAEAGAEAAPSTARIRPGKEAVEALLFAAGGPLAASQIASLLGRRVKPAQVKGWVETLEAEYAATGRCFQILEVAGGYRLYTRPEYFPVVKNLFASERTSRLSEAALDTLAVVAYKQPILKADVNQIRGVESGPILKALMEKGLIRAIGRAETLGRPILYGTTREFLEHFGLRSLKDMPSPEK